MHMMMNTEYIEQRKHRRVRVQEGVFGVLRPHFTHLGQIIDISAAGLALRYVASGGGDANESCEMDIFFGKDFYLGRIPFKAVSDFEIAGEFPNSPVTVRRLGVQFGELTEGQRSQLAYLMQNLTIESPHMAN